MKHVLTLVSCMIIALTTQTLHAQQSGWEISLGAGMAGENVYLGSNDYYITPLPSLNASYASGNVTYSLSLLDGVGITYMKPNWGLMASVNVNAGATRDPEAYKVMGISVKHAGKTKALLEGSPDLNTSFTVNTTLAYATPVGLFGVAATIHPTSVKYNQATQKDETRNGMVFSALYMIGAPVTKRLSLSGIFSIDIMDQTYADTWFGVDQPTKSLNTFKADAGLHSGMIALEAKYQLSKHISLSAVGGSTILMADAKNSPFTVETVQRTVMTQVLYNF